MARKPATRRRRINPPRVEHLKPPNFTHYLTLGELAIAVERDRDYIRRLERLGRLPEGARHKVGSQSIRLYSPAKVKEIKEIFGRMRVGRPSKT